MRIKKSGVYQIINEINGKSYIGSSIDIINRWNSHRHTFKKPPIYNSRLISAVRKYGLENFTFIILEECQPLKETILELEQYYIDTINPEYNILPKAGSNLGFKQPPSFFKKRCGVPAWNKGVPLPEDQKQKLMKANLGREPWNKGTHGLMPEPWNKGVPCSEETKQKLSESKIGQEAWNKGIPATEKEKQRLYEMFQANYTEEHQQKMTEAARIVNTGKERSEETKLKISESNRNSDARKTFAESRKGVERTDDVKEKIGKGIRESETFQNSVKARFGKSNNKGTHGNYGVTWRNDSNRWIVKIHNKKYGSFKTIEEAILRRDEIMVQLNANQN